MKTLHVLLALICSASLLAQNTNPTLHLREVEGQGEASSLMMKGLDNSPGARHMELATEAFVAPDLLADTEDVELLDSVVKTDANGLVAYHQLYAYNADGQRTLITAQDWDTVEQVWLNTQQFQYEYNALGQETLRIILNGDETGKQWVNYSKVVHEYNADGNQVLYLSYNWDSIWVPIYGEEAVWGMENGNKTRDEVYSQLDETTGQLEAMSREKVTYQGDGYVILSQINYVPTQDASWLMTDKYVQTQGDDGYDYTLAYYDYDTLEQKFIGTNKTGYMTRDNESLSVYYQWDSVANDWTSKTESISINGSLVAEISYVLEFNIWSPVNKLGYEGDYTIYYSLQDGDFVESYKVNSDYDENGNLTQYMKYDWDATEQRWYQSRYLQNRWDNNTGNWQVYYKIDVTYNSNYQEVQRVQLYKAGGSLDEWYRGYTYRSVSEYKEDGGRVSYKVYSLDQTAWDDTDYEANNWVFDYQKDYFYSIHAVNAGEPETHALSIRTYPNPAEHSLNISGCSAGETIEIYSIGGALLRAYTANDETTNIDISMLKRGQYLVKVEGISYKILKR